MKSIRVGPDPKHCFFTSFVSQKPVFTQLFEEFVNATVTQTRNAGN